MNIAWKVLSLGAGAIAGLVTNKVLDVVWEKGLGQPKPAGDESDYDLPILQVVAFTAVSAGVHALVSQQLERSANKAYHAKLK